MEVYVKESLFVLDYDNNIVDTIFTSDDHRSPGYALDITITEENTGYSDLRFNMPNTILTDNGDKIKNPKLALLTPLVKLRYRREVYYTGDKPITVREPVGYGDVVTYQDKEYSNVYPNNLIEDYIMDYIVQPVDKKRDVLKLTTSFTAMDYPRFTLSKKRVGMVIDQDSLTKKEWSLFKNKPLDEPGKIKYQEWTSAMSSSFKVGDRVIPTTWDPEHATEYPLTKENIIKLMADVSKWPYGLLATAFYWPIVSTGRFEGKMYKEGGYLTLHLYDFYALSKEGIDPDLYIDRYSWEWSQLYEIQPLLCPNNANNYLHYILDGTNWSVAKKDDGTDDVDVVKKDIPNPKGSTTSSELVDSTCNISVSNSNCYNAITEVCKGLQLYPVFDCINRTVALKVFAGKNYGLVYSLGQNLGNNSTKADGEKVITKLYVSGGKDYNGDTDINIGYAERTNLKTFTGFYKTVDSAPKTNVEGYWIVVDNTFTDSNFKVTKYNYDMTTKTETVHDIQTKNYWVAGSDRKVYFWNNTTSTWVLGKKESSGNWSGTVNGKEYIVDPITGTEAPWDPNADMYITARSPYGTNYILNLKWAYQNNWITQAQILELYQLELNIHDLDYMFMDGYTEDRRKTQQAYHDAANSYDIAQDGFQSTLYAMENKYYNVDGEISQGTTYCFHKSPLGTYIKGGKHYIKMFHCYNSSAHNLNNPATYPIAPKADGTAGNDITTCTCGSKDVTNDEIYIPVYNDFPFVPKESMYTFGTDKTKYDGPEYNPHLKGYFLRMVMSMDKASKDWEIEDYEKRVSLIKTIPFKDRTVTLDDGYDYKLENVYVRSTSGQIECWNESVVNYIGYYGDMLDYLRKVNACIARIEELQELYDKWAAIRDGYHAEIQNKFGDYLIEGNYKNGDQPYVGLLFKEGLEASDKFSVPEITYTLDVIDSSGLIEYREPTITKYICNECNYLSYTPMTTCSKCGCEVINTYHDVYNDLVKKLHSVGQIVPKAGDYCSVYDEPMGMFGVPALITEISRVLDAPYNNKIKLDTSYTDDEELVGNIITATNTVLSNADIYARTAVLKADGTVDETTLKNSLDNSNADITIVGTNGNILLNGSGLRATDPANPSNAMKYAGNGVFKTTNLGPEGEATIWEKMMSPSGINATYLNAGTIDTNKITVMSGLTGKVVIDQYGLAVKDKTSKSVHVTEFDASSAKADANYASTWGTNNNIASFIGVDSKNQPLIYTKGFIYAKEGSNIANWITSDDGFYHLNSKSEKDLWLSPKGISGTVNTTNTSGEATTATETFAMYANGNFGVTTTGKMYAKDAVVSGTITSNNATITGGSLKVGDNFSVDNQGNLIAKNINAYDGKIGQFTLTQTKLYSGSGTTQAGMGVYGSEYAFWAGSGTSSTAPFHVGHDGAMSSTKGSIGGWTIDSTTIKGGSTTLNSNGTITTSSLNCTGGYLSIKNSGWFSIGRASTHPIVSGLNLDVKGGLNFRKDTSVSSSGTETGASINSASGGGLNYGSGSGNHIFSGGNLYLSSSGDSSKATFSVETGTGNIETKGWIKAADSFGIRARRYNVLSANGNEYHGNGDSAGQAVCFRVQTTTTHDLYIFLYGGICVGFGTGPGAMAGFTDISEKYG